MVKFDKTKNKINIVKHYWVSVFSCVILFTTVCLGVWFDASQSAMATTMDEYPMAIAANPLAGAGDQLEGEAEQALGKAQRNLGKVSGQTEGMGKQVEGFGKQVKGNVKQGIEKTFNFASF